MSIYKPQKCLRCGHEWVARIMKVRLCPKCKSHLWDQPKAKASPRIDAASDLERLRDIYVDLGIPFQSAEFISVQIQSERASKNRELKQKSRHQIKVGSLEFLFDEKGTFLGIDAGAQLIPRESENRNK